MIGAESSQAFLDRTARPSDQGSCCRVWSWTPPAFAKNQKQPKAFKERWKTPTFYGVFDEVCVVVGKSCSRNRSDPLRSGIDPETCKVVYAATLFSRTSIHHHGERKWSLVADGFMPFLAVLGLHYFDDVALICLRL